MNEVKLICLHAQYHLLHFNIILYFEISMQEDFLHHIWKLKKFRTNKLISTSNEIIEIISSGQHNLNSGPDFFNAQLKIGYQLWAGNIEIHVKSSDWFVHNHELDKAYDNVILHVVWEHDIDVFRKDNTRIPTLQLKNYVSKTALMNYHKLFSKNIKWINCEKDFGSVDDFTVSNWLERLYFERLERKSIDIEKLLKSSANNWEAVLFKMLAKNFGLKVNGESFLSIAKSIDFSIIRKLQCNLNSLEALLFGQAGLLDEDLQDPFYNEMKSDYKFLKQKYQLSNTSVLPIQFFRLRPPNFPTIRLSQLVNLYHKHQNLFSLIIEEDSIDNFYDFFNVDTSPFWETHYSFGKLSKRSKKIITNSFVDLLLINTIIPVKFSYAKHLGQTKEEPILNLIQSISSEKNSIVDKFNEFKPISKSALQSQALIQLKNEYCEKNKCLQCAIGSNILTRND